MTARKRLKKIKLSKFKKYNNNRKKKIVILAYFLVVIPIALSSLFFLEYPEKLANNRWTIGRIPVNILVESISDPKIVDAYMSGNKQALHDRLKEKGIEEKIKKYYQPQFENELVLDLYVHQLFYDITGYLGQEYRVDSSGKLTLKEEYIPIKKSLLKK